MKTVWITGASSGIGEAIALAVVAQGDQVVLSARRGERLKSLQMKLGKLAHVFPLDVSQRPKVSDIVDKIEAEVGPVDVLVNNAGLLVDKKPAFEADLDQWETMVDTNIKGVLYCTRAILPYMQKRNHGYIINIGSISGSYPSGGSPVYGATKAFIKQFSLSLRTNLLGTGIRITNIEPGVTKTGLALICFQGNQEGASKFYSELTPLQAEDIASIVVWCMQQPPHVNINRVEVMPLSQAPAGTKKDMSYVGNKHLAKSV